MIRQLRLAALALALAFSLAWSGQNARQTGPQPGPTIRVTTRLVQVSVVAHDKKGQPVADLTKDDFVLLDEGKQREIAVFSVESSAAPGRELPPLPPDTYSNEIERQPGRPTSLTVILFDGLNTSFSDQAFAREQVIGFLRQLHPQDRVAILALGNQLRVLHDFTNDTESLVRAVEGYRKFDKVEELRPPEPGERRTPDALTPQVPPLLGEKPGSDGGRTHLDEITEGLTAAGMGRINGEIQRRATSITLSAMAAIANQVASLPGRKNLLWISGSFPFTNNTGPLGKAAFDTMQSEMLSAIGAVNNANIAIYPVDARGLVSMAGYMPSFSAAEGSRSTTARVTAWDADARARQQHANTLQAMKVLADRTGGRAFYDTNDIKTALRQAADDTRVSYVLGFYPNDVKWDGTFRRLRVQVKRPGVEIRYRQGFYALPDQSTAAEQHQKLVTDAARSPLEATAIRLTVRMSPLPPAGQPLRFEILLDPRDLHLEPNGENMIGPLTTMLVQKARDGKEIDNQGRIFQLKTTALDYAKGESIVIPTSWAIQPGAEQLRIAVCDAQGVLGSITVWSAPQK